MAKLAEYERYMKYLCEALGVSLASERGSLPIDWQLYLPEKWANC